MRARSLVLLLAAPALAGCIAQPLGPSSTPDAGLALAGLEVPEGATLEAVPGGALLRFEGVELPFRQNVTIPRGAVLVRVTAEVAEEIPVLVGMANAETGRRRCNGPVLTAWDRPFRGEVSCAGLAVVDPLPAVWTMGAAANLFDRLGRRTAVTGDVAVEILAVPLDGAAARLDLAQISPAVHDLLPTEVLDIPAHDGVPLRLEVTRPDGAGPVPVIIASSPYNHAARAAGQYGQWTYFVQDWAKRGYGVVMADVRGFGESGGCVEVWGPNEQRDQVTLVEWAASQPWSDGNVGFYGQSYVGTTPVEAAVQAPEALKAIVTIAPVINAYDDWHFGGVPNGEHSLSPVVYQQLGTQAMGPLDGDPVRAAENTANGLCDPTLALRASDPRALYDSFYAERNFSARASEVKAAVLYTEGFEDSNVKSSMIAPWFNALTAPKLGLFGHWVHQHPTRADQELLFLAWMEQYVKGKPVGVERLLGAEVVRNDRTLRTAAEWPPSAPATRELFPDFAAGSLGAQPAEGSALVPLLAAWLPLAADPADVVLEGSPEGPLAFAGGAEVRVRATLEGLDNAYLAAYLEDVGPDGSALVTWGMVNFAHRAGHHRYEPVRPGEVVEVGLPLLPTEWVVQDGHALRLTLRAARVDDWALVDPTRPGLLRIEGGAEGTRLVLPLAPSEGVVQLPASAS